MFNVLDYLFMKSSFSQTVCTCTAVQQGAAANRPRGSGPSHPAPEDALLLGCVCPGLSPSSPAHLQVRVRPLWPRSEPQVRSAAQTDGAPAHTAPGTRNEALQAWRGKEAGNTHQSLQVWTEPLHQSS